ncbi:glycosyltransferase family 39 protein [Streptomyces sp. SID14478]|uniref:ArnT family glycosyltransferase n=1 Tax=Streptomyces sp. SID14478 TaxID=2706073 RepID=UPI0013D9E59A|nr:glycosyltransferase family 39 protein [Streptomyces sp. SID14478]NEB78994.1 glycosyltransferase family 39 protein [Streptomyces sp. SID14478]
MANTVPVPAHTFLHKARQVPAKTYLVGVLLLTASAWNWLQGHEPHFAHEEAVYANKARSWLDDTPDAGWGLYRPIGLPALGRLALAVHNDVGSLRVIALLLSLFTLTAVYLVAAQWTSRRRAIVIVLVLLSGLGFLRRVPEFLNDIGSTGLLLIAVYLLVRTQEKQNSRALYVLPVVVLAAFYLRYGIVGNMLAIAIAAVLAYGPRAWMAQGRRLAFAAATLFLGLLPHFIYATKETGSPLGLIFWATDQAERRFIGDGLLYYLAIFPYRLAGDLGAVVMVAGIVALAAAARRLSKSGWRASRLREETDQRTVFLGTSAVLICVILGFATDGEPRFIYLPVILLTILGVTAIANRVGRHWASAVLAAVAMLAAVTTVATTQVIAHGAMPGPERLSDSTRPVAQQLSANTACLIVSGYEPEMGWYSGCDAVTYREYRHMEPPANTDINFVLFERGRLQPDEKTLKKLLHGRKTDVRTIPTNGSAGDATVLTLRS